MPVANPCPFCEYFSGARPCPFVYRDANVSVFLNRAQYERGALLVAPNRHLGSFLDLEADLTAAIYSQAHRMGRLLLQTFGATGLNIFQNNGASSGQTVPHFHVHVIPRYPDSDSARRFREGDFPITPFEELESLARELRGKEARK